MDLKYLESLVKIFDNSSVTELSIEEHGVTVNLSKNNTSNNIQTVQVPHSAVHSQVIQHAAPSVAEISSNTPEVPSSAAIGETIKSPMVGTFYGAPSPDSPAFVKVGDKVSKGQTLCIVEAMKLMNEIESDVSGTILEVLAKNAAPVEYNQDLFVIKPD